MTQCDRCTPNRLCLNHQRAAELKAILTPRTARKRLPLAALDTNAIPRRLGAGYDTQRME